MDECRGIESTQHFAQNLDDITNSFKVKFTIFPIKYKHQCDVIVK